MDCASRRRSSPGSMRAARRRRESSAWPASHGILNAFATKLLSRKFVIINSALADACTDPRQLDFVVGHELGHLAAGHLAWNALLLPFHLVPWLGTAYSRARGYTRDRAGF